MLLNFCNMYLVDWLSKKQHIIETSVFGADFVALKHVMKALRGIQYKLLMMVMHYSGFSYVHGYNISVIHKIQRPESTLRKKSNSICHHAVCESVVMGDTKTAHISTHDNSSDLLTKVLYGSKKKKSVGKILYDIYD